jgi:uroporphyrinogen III methyltransferase/synthase
VEAGQRVLLLRADIASDVLADILKTRGVPVSDVNVYRTRMPAPRAIDLEGADAITFTSSSTVRHFMAMLDDAERAQARAQDIFCIGPVTALTAREFGLDVSAVAGEHTLDGLVAALVKFYGGN